MKKSEDTKAILARREAFVNKVLSKEETGNVKGGALKPCLKPQICLTICLTIEDPCLISDPCLIKDPIICLSIEPIQGNPIVNQN